MTKLSFVREEMIAEQAPPASSVGLIGWLRANMFSGPVNSALSLLTLALVFFILKAILPWIFNGVWNANSLNQCREIIRAAHGPNATAACWAVIHERIWQLIYGFYPSELYWRPTVAFVLLATAVAPILFPNLPKKMLAFSALYPFIGAWLMWGGSVWTPVMVVVGFFVGYAAYVAVEKSFGSLAAIIAAVLAAMIWWMFLVGPLAGAMAAFAPIHLKLVESRLFGGFMLSIAIGITGIAGSFPLGLILALGRRSDLLIVKTLSIGFIEFIRGVPLITLLLVASSLLNIFLPPGTNFDIILRVMIMVTLFSSAYMAEVIRGGLAALPAGQYEAADALGLDFWKAQRLIIMPQALKISIPGIVSTFIGLFKDTTLVSIISLFDPLGFAKAIQANAEWNGIVWELYAFIAFVFWVICFSMSRYSMHLERKLQTGHQ